MMSDRKVLLVDDELLVIQAVRENIRWEHCGVSEVFLCTNVNEAKQAIEDQMIHLVISDIEMPGIDGLSFVGWLRERYPQIPVILLTGYAEFEYAKAAVALKVEEYMLKPVIYEQLAEKIRKALERAEFEQREREMKQRYTIGRGALFSECVRYILADTEQMPAEEIPHLFARFHMHFSADHYYILIWVRLRTASGWEWAHIEQLKKEMIDAWRNLETEVHVSNFVQDKLLACLELSSGNTVEMDAVRERLSDIIRQCQGACACFITELLQYDQLVPMIHKLSERDTKNVIYQNRVVLVGKRNIHTDSQPLQIDFTQWAILLSDGEWARLQTAIDFSIHSIVIDGQMDVEVLRSLYNHFMQLVYHYIGQNFESRESIVQDEQLLLLQKHALNSVEDFRFFVSFFIQKIRQTVERHSTENVTEMVKQFIEDHLAEKISRRQIAEHVALNENYLSRLFHKETGYSISDYIMQKRLRLAKNLLTQTSLSVSVIGERVGYDTTNYFIRLFKREVGRTPKEYRREMKI